MNKNWLYFSLTVMLIAVIPFSFCGQGRKEKSNLTVVLIRHGEKPADGDNLSCKGLNRAMQLPGVIYSKFGVPDYTYIPAPSSGKSTAHVRMLQTVTPFAIRYNLKLNSKYNEDETDKVAADVRKRSGTVLLVWEHNAIPAIARALGVSDVNLNWKDKDYDSIWIITYSDGKAVMKKDKEGLDPSPDCK